MCCIIETLVRKDRSGKWSEHGRRAHVIYNLETLETKEPKTGFFEPQQRYTWFQQRNSDQRTFLRTTKPRIVPRTTYTMLGLMQYPQRVLLHKQQKRPRTFLAILKYVAAQQPTDRQFRYSNRPIRSSTRLSRYYGRYHEHLISSHSNRKLVAQELPYVAAASIRLCVLCRHDSRVRACRLCGRSGVQPRRTRPL